MDFHKIGKNGQPYDIIDDKIACYIIEHEHIIVIAGKPYIYKNGVYKRDEDGNILRYLIKSMIIQEIITVGRINRVYNLIVINHKLAVDTEDVNRYPSHWINFKNGMLDVITGEMHEHSPKYLSISQIPHNYMEGLDITQSTFYKFVKSRIRDEENRRMLFEFMGYCLTKDVAFQKFMLLYGLGESGKSTIINFLTGIVGHENTCSIPLQQLGDRFTTASLLLKILNTCGDLTNTALTDTSVIKQLTGDDRIKGEYKGGAIFYFRNHAKMIFSCNELPKVLDEKSNGFYRRLLIIRFSESGEYIPNLKKELAEESEIEMVISGLVSGLKSALIGGKLFESSANISEIEGLKYESDTVAAFLSDMTEKREKWRVKRSDMYLYYRDYCITEGRTPLGKSTFFKSMRLKGHHDRLREGIWYFYDLDIAFQACEMHKQKSAFDKYGVKGVNIF